MFWILMFLMLDLDETLTEAFEVWSLSSDTTTRIIRNLHVLKDFRKRPGGQVESWQGSWCYILMKLLKDDPYQLKPPPGSSENPIFFKTPGRNLEDKWSLDRVPDEGSRWNFHRSFIRTLPFIWPNSRPTMNLQVLQDFRNLDGRKLESWQSCWCWILMNLQKDTLIHLTLPLNSMKRLGKDYRVGIWTSIYIYINMGLFS